MNSYIKFFISISLFSQYSQAETLKTIIVEGDFLKNNSKKDLQTFGGARTVINTDEAADLGDNSIIDVFKRIPGVVASEQNSQGGSKASLSIGVRGMPQRLSPNSTILVDGIPLAPAPYGQPQLSVAPLSFNMLSQVDVIRGGATVRYGPQNVGGVVNFITKDVPDSFEAEIGTYATYYGSGNNGLQSDSVSLFAGDMITEDFGVSISYDGNKGAGYRDNSDNNMDNILIKGKYKINSEHTLTAKLQYWNADTDAPGGLTTQEYQDDAYQSKRPEDTVSGTYKQVALIYEGQINPNLSATATTFYNTTDREIVFSKGAPDVSTRLDRLPRDYETFGIEGRLSQKLEIASIPSELSIGYRYINEDANEQRYRRDYSAGDNPYDTSETLNRDSHNTTNASSYYTDWRWQIGKLTLTPGVRYEDVRITRTNNLNGFHEEQHYYEILPALSTAYQINDTWSAIANYNRSFGSVQHLQLNTNPNPAGETTLEPEIADIYELGTRAFGDFGNLEATLFYIDFSNRLGYNGDLEHWDNRGETVHQGLELGSRIYLDDMAPFLGGVSLYGNYTYLDATYRGVDDTGANLEGNRIEYTSEHAGQVGFEYLQESWSAFIEVYAQSDQFSDELNTVDENVAGDLGRIPGYATVNLGYNKELEFDDHKVNLQVGIKNLLNKESYTRSVDSLGNGKYVNAPRSVYFGLKMKY